MNKEYRCVCVHAQINELASRFKHAYLNPVHSLAFKQFTIQLGIGGQTPAYNPGSLYFTNFYRDSRR